MITISDLIEVFWKSGVVLGFALCLNVLLRKKSADLRRLVLSVAIVAMFAAAAVLPALPRWTAVAPAWFSSPTPQIASVSLSGSSPEPSESQPASSGVVPPQSHRTESLAWRPRWTPGIIPLLWLTGTLILLTRIAVNLRSLHRLRLVSEAVWAEELPAYLHTLIRRPVALLQNESISAPVTWGTARPVILVPPCFGQLPAEHHRAVLRHEVAHIESYDFSMRILAEIMRALIWFQPLIWIARRQLREEQELACDNRVLAAGGKPSAYAKLLLDWDRYSAGADALIAVGIAHRSSLKRRLLALLEQDQRRDSVSAMAVLATLFLALGMALPLAALSFSPRHAPVAPAQQPLTILAQVQLQQQAPTPNASRTPADFAANLEFEVASIKPFAPNSSGGFRLITEGGPGTSDPGRITYTNLTFKRLLMAAYGVGDDFISGPAWLDTERYVITATIRPGATKLQVNQMLQNLLTRRFQMTIHRETRDLPLYELTVAGKGPQLKEYVEGAAYSGPAFARGFPGGGDYPYQFGSDGLNHAAGVKAGIAQLINFLSFQLKRPVLDKTGLTGLYDYSLDFLPDLPAAESNDSLSLGPNLITAVRDQLGMKLTAKKGPLEIIVVDHAEKTPAEN